MKLKLSAYVIGFVFITQGCFSQSSIQQLGVGGVFSIESKGMVYDFSKDSKYLWLSETECCDLTGRLVDISTLGEASYPLPRMMWKRRILGTDSGYHLSRSSENINAQAERWWNENHLPDGQKVDYVSSELTFPAMSAPLVTVSLSSYDPYRKNIAIGVCSDGGESKISFQNINITYLKCDKSFSSGIVLSSSLNRASDEERFSSNMRFFYDIGTNPKGGTIEVSNVVAVAEKEIVELLGDKKVRSQEFFGRMFLSDNYFAFPVRRGGCRSFLSRDYLLIYGFREKQIVKAFKSRWMIAEHNDTVTDVDVVLSADEKYIAIRYEGEITVYPFNGVCASMDHKL